jgi:hypothetical protein
MLREEEGADRSEAAQYSIKTVANCRTLPARNDADEVGPT